MQDGRLREQLRPATQLPVPVPGPFCLKAYPGRRLSLWNQKADPEWRPVANPCINPQFDLVCEGEINDDIMKTIFLAGLLIGALLFGLISDK